MTEDATSADRALAIADIVDYNESSLDQVEGCLLMAAGRGEKLTPATVALETDLSREAATDLFRQLLQIDAIHRDSEELPLVGTRFEIFAPVIRPAIDKAREGMSIVDAYQRRTPQTDVIPLVTFPEDPAFAETSPADFEMEGLMSKLASEVKQSKTEIVLLSPFFEGEGFDRLADVLLNALERGVEVTIVTRYLADRDSHNHSVIGGFLDRAREEGVEADITTVDYTVWDEGVPAAKRRQDGVNPALTLHAKVMLFDTRAVYVGSANVTDYGFDRYLELGVLLKGARVRPYRYLCNFLLESDSTSVVEL